MHGKVEQYRRWFEYEQDSHHKALDSLLSVPPELRPTEAFQKAVDLMAHVVAARFLWLNRLGASSERPADLFPQGSPLADLSVRLEQMHEAWSVYLGQLTDTELTRGFEYQSSEGARYRNTVEDVLTQVFGHSWYHRGQVAALIRSIGAVPAVTDFVFWAREPAEASSDG